MKLGDEPILFQLSFTPCKAEQPQRGMKLQEREEKDENHRGNCIERNPKKKMSINRLKAIYIIDHRKAFCGQRIPESSCAKKETVSLGRKVTEKSCNLLE